MQSTVAAHAGAVQFEDRDARKLRVGILWHCVYPWDIRLEKMARAFSERGHEVSVVSKGRGDLLPVENDGSVSIRRVLSGPRGLPSPVRKAAGYPLFVNPIWRSAALATFKAHQVDVIIVRDLPLAMLAVSLGRQLKKPVVLDMAENYPAALQAYENPKYRPFLFGNAWLPRTYEKVSLSNLDHVWVVAEEQSQRLLKLGVPAAKITLVGNTPTMSFLDSVPARGRPSSQQHPSLLYVGKLDRHRGVDVLIYALPALLAEFPRLRLTLVGDGKDKARLESLARELNVSESVDFSGWVKHSGMASFIQDSTLCLIPHVRCEHTETTLPNKLFDYMAYSKPVVASDCQPLARIIGAERCGTTFKSGDVASLSNAVRSLLKDPDLITIGANGRRAVEGRYNWGLDKSALLQSIEDIDLTWRPR